MVVQGMFARKRLSACDTLVFAWLCMKSFMRLERFDRDVAFLTCGTNEGSFVHWCSFISQMTNCTVLLLSISCEPLSLMEQQLILKGESLSAMLAHKPLQRLMSKCVCLQGASCNETLSALLAAVGFLSSVYTKVVLEGSKFTVAGTADLTDQFLCSVEFLMALQCSSGLESLITLGAFEWTLPGMYSTVNYQACGILEGLSTCGALKVSIWSSSRVLVNS